MACLVGSKSALRPFTVEDGLALSSLSGQVLLQSISVRARFELAARGYAWTLWIDDERVAAGGVLKRWDGCGEAWFVASLSRLTSNVRTVLQAVRSGAREATRFYSLRRLDTLVEDDPRLVRFARACGFVPEYPDRPMRRFGPNGEDYYVMVYQ